MITPIGVGYIFRMLADTSKGPLAEAAFLDKSSSVTAAIDSTEIDVPGADDSNDVKLSTRVVFENEFILEASYTDFDAADDSALNIGVGVYLNDDTDIVLSYTDFDEADNSTLKLDMHSVKSLGDDTFFAYDLGVSYLDVGEDDGFGIDAGVDYYFTREGASVAHASLDNFDSTEVSIDASYFVAPSIELSAIYSTFSQDADGDFFSIAAAVRF